MEESIWTKHLLWGLFFSLGRRVSVLQCLWGLWSQTTKSRPTMHADNFNLLLLRTHKDKESICSLNWSAQDGRFKVFYLPCWASESKYLFPWSSWFIGLFYCLSELFSHRLSGQRCSCIKPSFLHLYSSAVSLFGCLVKAVNASWNKSYFLLKKIQLVNGLGNCDSLGFKETSCSLKKRSYPRGNLG